MFVYKIQVNPIHTILKHGDYYDFMIMVQLMALKRTLKINNSWPELLYFQISFNWHWLELLRTAPLPMVDFNTNDDGFVWIYVAKWKFCRNSVLLRSIIWLFDAVSNIISVIYRRPVHLTMIFWGLCYHYFAQFSFQVTGCFPRWLSSKK